MGRRLLSRNAIRPSCRCLSHVSLPPDYDGWLVYTVYNDTAGFDVFLGDFSVPQKPSSVPDILYIFTGL
eukprot:EC718520.1.p1 GENE.EC718520.1~~EC718520.1.p1  ORF type:complete len:69 (+),score=2.41 EC718520.1:181-387(+)